MTTEAIDALGLSHEDKEKFSLWLDANQSYYDISKGESEDEPLMSDEQFEQLHSELLSLNVPELTKWLTTTIWSEGGLVPATEAVSQMVSLKKEKYESRASVLVLLKFLDRRVGLMYGPKLDGIAIKVFLDPPINGYYQPKMIITRGGLDVTDILMFHKDFQFSEKDWNIGTLLIHGELVLPKRLFLEKWSEESGNIHPYVNARNAVPGVLKRDPNDLKFMPCTDGISPLQPLDGSNRQNIWKAFNNEQEIYGIEAAHQFFKSDDFPYQTDGVVVGYPAEKQEIKDNYVKNMIAVKFKAPSAKVTIKDIIYTQKKSGALTPVVLYDPVLLDGSYPSRATAYNYNNLKVLHIGIGAEVLITKSGDIIPVVDKVLKRSDNIPMPDVEYYISGKHMYAVNMEVSTSYKFVLGLKLLQIDGIGETLAMQIGAIVDYDIIKLFDTANKPAIRLVLGGGKVWDKFDIFYQTRTLTLDMLINLLQFNGCGKVLSRTFANIILGDKSQSVAGIDKNVLNMVCRGEGFKRINDAMKLLVTYGVRVVRPIKIDDSSLTFEMTGTPPGMTKGEFAAKLKQQYPNSVHVSLTKDTKVLFVDTLSSNSSKLNRARKYNLRILTYEQGLKGEA